MNDFDQPFPLFEASRNARVKKCLNYKLLLVPIKKQNDIYQFGPFEDNYNLFAIQTYL